MKTQPAEKTAYKACSTEFFRAEFGVCRGEVISQVSDLNLGDVYHVKLSADWKDVEPLDDASSEFYMDEAANLPPTTLVTLAELTFMTTTGRRADVFATMVHHRLFMVAEAPLKTGEEYVLVEIKPRDVSIEPNDILTAAVTRTPLPEDRSNVVPLRLMG